MPNCCTLWFKGNWNDCCCSHDKDYYKSGLSRKASDEKLRDCVISKAKYKLFGILMGYWMYAGVRLFGRSRYERKQSKGIESG